MNEAEFVRVANVGSVAEKGQQVWSVDLKPEPPHDRFMVGEPAFHAGGQNYKPEDFVRLRAGRLLLNDPPLPTQARSHFPSNDGFLESFIRGSNARLPADKCVVRQVFADRNARDKATLQMARLAALVALTGSGVCEQVLELSLGPVAGGACHVRFRGVRNRQYTNVEPAVVELEGDCPLA